MNIDIIEKRLSLYLERHWKLADITPFLLVYIRLILLFKSELSQAELNVVLEREKQLRGDEFTDDGFDELRRLCRKEIDQDVENNTSAIRKGLLNRLLFCALLDTEENDFFYLIEPIFEFVREMEISPDQLRLILESEFAGFKT